MPHTFCLICGQMLLPDLRPSAAPRLCCAGCEPWPSATTGDDAAFRASPIAAHPSAA